ncbi:MAG: hypothetical protein IAX21_06415 [Candidatus Bathyarchaeota archaeon]|nr:hypothetical protein [Candidatus Bathyarchaeum tardum]WNZ28306.1 MAG: hypothetical protein IAX21_06415 [Candidatus Bathyarchaeota archaeon]
MSNIWDEIEEEDKDIEEIAQKIMMEIEEAHSNSKSSAFIKSISQLSDIDYVKRLLRNVELAHTKPVCTLEKLDIIKGLIIVTWMQRMYSTIRSLLLGVIAALVLLPLLLSLGSLNFIQNVIIAVPIFVVGLTVTRLLDKQIITATKKVVKYLSNHKKLRKFIMNNF